MKNLLSVEIEKAIRSINKGKACDIFDLSIDHILYAGKVLIDFLLLIIQQIFEDGITPEILKMEL